MRTTVKFPALMVALPQRHKNPKIAVGLFDTTVELSEVERYEFPVAITCENDNAHVDYRTSGGRLYRDSGLDAERMLKRHHDNVLSPRDWSRTAGAIVRDMDRAVKEINDYSEDTFWPPSAKRIVSAGVNPEYDEFKQVAAETASLRLSGPWLENAAVKNPKLLPFLAEGQEERLARYEKMTKDVFAAMRVFDGSVWVPVAEPCYVVQTMPDAYGRCMASDFAYHEVTADNDENRRSWWNDIGDRAFSITERDHVLDNMLGLVKKLPEFHVHIPEALKVNIPEIELDRCARVLVNKVAENAARRASDFVLPSTETVEAFTALTELTRTYDPFDHVPDEVEGAVQALLAAVESHPGDHYLIAERDRRFAEGYLERWADRVVDFEICAGMTP